jgi:hypothetical protein
MDKFDFLSADWVEESRRLRGVYRDEHGESHRLVANYTITDVPFLDGGTAEFHLDFQSPLFYEKGHVESADYQIATDYETARTIYHDTSWGLDRLRDAYSDGSIQIEGPVEELREFWADVIREPDHIEMYDRIMEFTA